MISPLSKTLRLNASHPLARHCVLAASVWPTGEVYDVVNKRFATLIGSPTLIESPYGPAYQTNGVNSGINFGRGDRLDNLGALTVVWWGRLDAYAGSAAIMSKNNAGWTWYMTTGDRWAVFRSNGSGYVQKETATSTIATGLWSKYIFTHDGSVSSNSMEFYTDYNPYLTAFPADASSFTPSDSSYDLTVGLKPDLSSPSSLSISRLVVLNILQSPGDLRTLVADQPQIFWTPGRDVEDLTGTVIPRVRATQIALEVTGTNPGDVRATQIALEITLEVKQEIGSVGGLLPIVSHEVYTVGGRVGMEPNYGYSVEFPFEVVLASSPDFATFVGTSAFSAFITKEWEGAVSLSGSSGSQFNPGGATWQGALSVSGVGNFTSLGKMIYQAQRVLAGGNGDVYFLASKFYDESLLVYGYGDVFFFGGYLVVGSTEPMTGRGNARFTSGKTHAGGDLFLRSTGDIVFQALIHTGGFQQVGEFYKVFVVDDRDLRYLTMQDIRLVLPQNSRYRTSEVILARDVVMLSSFRARQFLPDPTDLVYETILPDDGRLDLVSSKMYGSASLWWVLAIINGIRDPFTLPVGTMLRIPTHDRILREVLSEPRR